MITQAQKQELKKLLLDEKQRIEKELHSFTIENPSSPGGHETVFFQKEKEINPEDQAAQEERYLRMRSLEQIFEQRLEEINQALERLDSDDFGVCQNCRKQIPWERLKLNPAATACIDCAS
ncbi:MAG: TraR/DksA C4-type zinc finger protein [Patescibacteria group bacterium]